MDGLALAAVVYELQPLVDGKIDKVQQPDSDALLLTVRAPGRTSKLLLSAHAENGRVQLTSRAYENPADAPMFCMLLRKRLVGGRIAAVEQAGLDRVLTLRVAARDELYDETSYRLIIELMGKYSNIILVDAQNTVLDCIKHVGPGMSQVRQLLPGLPFTPAPGQDKKNPFCASEADFAACLSAGQPSEKALPAAFMGLSRASCAALGEGCAGASRLHARFSDFAAGSFAPTLVLDAAGEPVAVYPFAVPGGERAESMSEAYERYYEARDAAARRIRYGAQLRRTLSSALSRAENKLAAFDEAIANEAECDRCRLCGELILANLASLRRGQREAALPHYDETGETRVSVSLDPGLSPRENAQRYFKRDQKSRAARAYAVQERAKCAEERDYLAGQLQNLENCATLAELGEIRDELAAERYIRPARGEKKRAPAPRSAPLRFRSTTGMEIFVGKNNRQNDALTKSAAPEAMFLHVKNMPGSHVIVPSEPDAQTLREAAMLSAYYSTARGSASVSVDYTPRKFVKKPAGARPGMVIYSTNKTLFVTPDPAVLRTLEEIK